MSNGFAYPGYSWSFTQHAVGLDPETLYSFLACASLFQGEKKPGPSITKEMIANNLLTANLRDGKADAWRDYQQVLAELGLIYSTSLVKNLRLTDAGFELLAGNIGGSELMTMQALRYQYPNGQKHTIQSRLKKELMDAKITVPDNLIDLQTSKSILIKPGLLVLRILLELYKKPTQAELTVDECGGFLVPIHKNNDWGMALNQIIDNRGGKIKVNKPASNVRRNIQDWFKFLSKTDLFVLTGSKLTLSKYAIDDREKLKQYCDEQEDPSTFWIPVGSDKNSRISWFDYYGELPFEAQKLLQPRDMSAEYMERNYIGGLEEERDEKNADFDKHAPVFSLSNLDTDKDKKTDENKKPPSSGQNIKDTLSNLREGIFQRKIKTALHDSIVNELGEKFKEQGAIVYEDRASVDLLVTWPDGSEGIFEVKTVNRRSLQNRLRLAIGQVEEYYYRRNKETSGKPDRVIVINQIIPDEAWQLDFLTNHLSIGLIGKTKAHYKANAPTGAKTFKNWLN